MRGRDIADAFLDEGARRRPSSRLTRRGDDVEVALRRQRHGLALAVALGDLAGELSLEQVTRLLSDFADSAIDAALTAAIAERVPGRRAARLRSHRHGQARQPRAQLFVRRRPAAAVRSRTAAAGASATMPAKRRCAIGRRLIELLQKRTADGYVERVDLRLRPSPEVTPIALPVHAAISHYEISARCRGSGPPSSARARLPATLRLGSASSTRSSRSSGGARSISE